MKFFKDKTLLVTGGSGSFGNAILKRFLKSDLKEIRIFSRDEKKQEDMRKFYKNSKIKFYIGDVRDYKSILDASRDVDFIFHAAALKQVPSCEFYPLQAMNTNIIGTENVLEASIVNKVKKVICLSTDKAVYPINAMGISKALMEKVAIAKSRSSKSTTICVTRYGNVMASRGSVIPLFINLIKQNKPITVTNNNMTRFMMSLENAVDLVIYAFINGKSGEIFVQKAPSASIDILVQALKEIFNKPNNKVVDIGIRHGEKLYETLITKEEMIRAKELKNYFKILPDLRDLNYKKYFEEGIVTLDSYEDYNSNNTRNLKLKELKLLLLTIPFVQKAINGDSLESDY